MQKGETQICNRFIFTSIEGEINREQHIIEVLLIPDIVDIVGCFKVLEISLKSNVSISQGTFLFVEIVMILLII